MNNTIPIIGAGVAAIAVAETAFTSYREGEPIGNVVSRRASAITSAASSVVRNGPLYSNNGNRATLEQIAEWERKVGRSPSKRNGIMQVDRVRTTPYVNASHPLDLRGFARLAAEGADVPLRGGYVLAVLLSVETGAGRSTNCALWNHNAGNFKLYREQRLAERTPPCYFLVDNIRSLDFYPAFGDLPSAIAAWKSVTFGNARYNQYGTMRALERGNLNDFCQAIGRAGYARSYALDRRAMEPRARLLMRDGRYSRMSGPPSLDRGVMELT